MGTTEQGMAVKVGMVAALEGAEVVAESQEAVATAGAAEVYILIQVRHTHA